MKKRIKIAVMTAAGVATAVLTMAPNYLGN